MLKLEPVSAEPFWLDVLSGVRIQFRPVSVAAMLIARGAADEALKAGGEQATIEAGAAFIIAAVLVLVVVVEKGLGIDVPGVDVGSDWLTQILAALGLGTLRAGITGASK
ncbi:hypothetical protein [Rhodopseudomonas palustris]|uniref:Uncharacterized protein n=1 Tax=Rhodopseudomonas palustris (strain BisB18) TaxID=316056 RepID=Q21D33_RHOPB